MVRVPPDIRDALDTYIATHRPGASRPDAIRFLLRDSLTGLGYLPHFDDPKDAN